MKFNIVEKKVEAVPGQVYKDTLGTALWVVIAVKNITAFMLAINPKNGEISAIETCPQTDDLFNEPPIGYCDGIANADYNITLNSKG